MANTPASTLHPQSHYDRSVNAGAKWLDKHVPDWLARVKVNSLDMASGCRCVLGQVFKKEAKTAIAAGRYEVNDGYSYVIETRKFKFRNNRDVRLGFDAGDWDPVIEYRELGAAWRRLIKARKAALKAETAGV